MQTSKTYAEVLAWESARVGLSGLPREWTPSTWDSTENDCAVFQSTALFGDMRYYVVSQFYNDAAAHGQLVAAATPGALACFRWPGSGDNFDHIGLVTSGADAQGNFHTLEANTSGPISGHQVAAKVRPTAYVVGFAMPQYAPAPANVGPVVPIVPPITPVDRLRKENAMYGLVMSNQNPTVYACRLADSAHKALTYAEYMAYLSAGYTLKTVTPEQLSQWVNNSQAW